MVFEGFSDPQLLIQMRPCSSLNLIAANKNARVGEIGSVICKLGEFAGCNLSMLSISINRNMLNHKLNAV